MSEDIYVVSRKFEDPNHFFKEEEEFVAWACGIGAPSLLERITEQEEELEGMLAQIKSLRQNVDTLRQTVSNLEYLYDKARGIDGEL